MYAGHLMEYGDAYKVFNNPFHPYTMGLKGAFPSIKEPGKSLIAIPGSPPQLTQPPPGCRFSARCPFPMKDANRNCRNRVMIEEDHYVSCHRMKEAEQHRTQITRIYSSQMTGRDTTASEERTQREGGTSSRSKKQRNGLRYGKVSFGGFSLRRKGYRPTIS